MLRNYFKIAFRNLTKQKFYSLINILGLTVGITAFLFLLLYVQDELSYDKYHPYSDRIYRVDVNAKIGEQAFVGATNAAIVGPTMKQDFPEVESFFRFRDRGSYLVKYEKHHYKEKAVIFADSTLFQFFDLKLISGDPKTALAEPNAVVISEEMAEKYFGIEDPIGKTMLLDNQYNHKVTGVIEAVPKNTHFNYDFFLSLSTLEESRSPHWGSMNFNNYVILKKGTDWKVFEKKLSTLIDNYFAPQIMPMIGATWEDFTKAGNYANYELFPLEKIHLYSDKVDETAANGNIQYVYIFSIIGFFILLIACINFMNLSTARSANRAKEVGVRKVVGAMRNDLVQQFLSESILLSLIALVLGWFSVQLLLPYFNDLAGKELELSQFQSPGFLLTTLGLAIFIGLLAGSYPAFFLSKFQPSKVLKGSLAKGAQKSNFRNSLVIFQFIITTVLIAGTIVVYNQLEYCQTKKLGYEKEQVLMIQDAYALGDNVQAFKNKMLQNPKVVNATVSGFVPVPSSRNTNAFWKGKQPNDENVIILGNWTIDHDYVATLGMNILEGRDFSRDFPTDSSGVILNEQAIKAFGFEGDPIGQEVGTIIDNEGNTAAYKVIGVVEDFHFESLRNSIAPVGFFLGNSRGLLSLRINTNEIQSFIQELQGSWNEMAPGQPFAYGFMDDRYNRIYEAESRIGKIIGTFAFLAIFIACIGLLGLATYTAQQRTKEIGIRKVLGAGVPDMVYLLSKDFGKLILIAFFIAVPFTWYFMDQWLMDFEYSTKVSWVTFALAGMLILVIAILTIIYQSTRVALVNPVDTLKQE